MSELHKIDAQQWRDAPQRDLDLRAAPGAYSIYYPAGVSPADRVDVRFRNGEVRRDQRVDELGAYWRRDDSEVDIVAWRPHRDTGHDYAFYLGADEVALLAASLAPTRGPHDLCRAGRCTADGLELFTRLHEASDGDVYRAVRRAYCHDRPDDPTYFPSVDVGATRGSHATHDVVATRLVSPADRVEPGQAVATACVDHLDDPGSWLHWTVADVERVTTFGTSGRDERTAGIRLEPDPPNFFYRPDDDGRFVGKTGTVVLVWPHGVACDSHDTTRGGK